MTEEEIFSNLDKSEIDENDFTIGQSTGYSRKKYEEFLLLAGLTDSKKADVLFKFMEDTRKTLLTDAKERYQKVIKSIKDRINQLNKEKIFCENTLKELTKEITKLYEEIKNYKTELTRLLASKKSLSEELTLLRINYPERLLEHKIAKYDNYNKRIINIIQEQAKFRNEHELELREINKEERKRRIDYFENLKKKAEESLTELEKYLSFFRKIGITKTTAGFLLWSGYFSLPAMGWFLGGSISSVQAKNNVFFEGFLSLFINSISAISKNYGTGVTFVTILLMPLILLFVVFAVIFAVDKVLNGFDSGWNTQKKKKEGSSVLNSGGTLSDIVLNPNKELKRSDFGQLLAKGPILYIWIVFPMLIAFLFNFSNRSESIDDFVKSISQPGSSIIYAYLGIVISLLITSLTILYSVKVIEIRFRRLAEKETIEYKDILKSNMELIALVILCLIIFIPGDFFYYQFYSKSLWGSQNISILLIIVMILALVLSYGLIYRGIYRDHEAFIAVINKYDNKIQEYTASPIINVANDEIDNFITSLKELQKEINIIWSDIEFWRKPIKAFKTFPFLRKFYKEKATQPNSNSIEIDFRLADAFFEPNLTSLLRVKDEEIDIQNMFLNDANSELSRVKAEIEMTRNTKKEIELRKDELLNKEVSAKQNYKIEIQRILNTYMDDLISSETLIEMGRKLRTRFSK